MRFRIFRLKKSCLIKERFMVLKRLHTGKDFFLLSVKKLLKDFKKSMKNISVQMKKDNLSRRNKNRNISLFFIQHFGKFFNKNDLKDRRKKPWIFWSQKKSEKSRIMMNLQR